MKFIAFLREKAVYLILLAGIFAVALFSFWALRGAVRSLTPQPEQPQEEKIWNEPKTEISGDEENIPILPDSGADSALPPESEASSSASQPADELPEEREASADVSAPAAASFVWPVTGEPGQVFSGDELVYNETLKDWRTHNGLDLTCPEGSEVKAAVAGKITAVHEDALWGWVVEEQSGDCVYRYCGLAAGPKMKAGAAVAAGDVLGRVGTTEAEQDAGSHLHFEILRGGVYQDPQKMYG